MERFHPYWRLLIVANHFALVIVAYLLAFLLRFDFRVPSSEWQLFLLTLPLVLVIRAVFFAWFQLYQGLWRYVSMQDILAMLKAVTLSSLLFLAAVLAIFGRDFPWSIVVLDWIICLALIGGVRLAHRAFRESSQRYRHVERRRTLIVGAGDGGELLIREMQRSLTLNYDFLGFVDDDPHKQGRRIHGIEVVGTVDQLPHLCRFLEVHEIVIATPSATRDQQQRTFARCRESGVPFKTVPSLNDLLEGKARIAQLQEVRPDDLLGRQSVRLDLDKLGREHQGKRILVTGAAGSIGSELCRQIAPFQPEVLLLFDRAESNLYFIDLELRREYPSLKVIPVVGDILDRSKVEEVIHDYAPDVFYHAAAYKHVPLMEAHPLEAIENNIFGTEAVAIAARRGSVKKLVFISTDKAVRPVGIMGMTKRMAECLLLCLNGGSTTFVAVRFGNVLGSDGSVLPLFRWQIANGGPVTVTEPEASRYFMLLSEAAQLVLQAGTIGHGGEVFFLDMGQPIRILDLAESLIRLTGLEPGRDMPIETIGLRPGERLQEELVMEQEVLLASEHEKVFLVQNHNFNGEEFSKDLEELRLLVRLRDRGGAVAQLKTMAGRY